MVESIFKTKKAKNIVLHDTRENLNLQILQIDGNTEQNSTSGKNLLDCSGLSAQTLEGITFTPVYAENGELEYINVNGASTGLAQFIIRTDDLLDKDYILNGCPSSGSVSTYRLDCFYSGDSSSNDGGTGVTFTGREGESLTVRILVFAGVTVSNVKFYPMIRDASITDGTYEPFTNGASPNPDYPQEIKSVEVSEIKTCGKNLFNKDNPILNATISNGVVLENEQYRIYAIPVKIGESYKLTKPSMSYCFGGFYNEIPSVGVTLTDRVNLATITDATITATDSYFCLIFSKDEDLRNVMFNLGTVALPYEPYTESKATLSAPITLNGISGVSDYIDVKRGVKVQKFGVVVFDGSDDEDWSAGGTATNGLSRFIVTVPNIKRPLDAYYVPYVLCTHYIATNPNDNWYAKQGISVGASSDVILIYDENFSASDVSLWKAHLQENPMTVVYELAEPIETPLSDADVESLESLKTFEGLTYVFLDSEINPKSISVLYELLQYRIDWTKTDYFNAEDYNRIIGNLTYLKAYLDSLFLGLTNISTMEEKTFESLIYAREINAIETALEQLNLETYGFDIGETKEYLPNTRTLDFVELNRIESAILLLYKTMTAHKEALPKLAFTLGGQKGFKV